MAKEVKNEYGAKNLEVLEGLDAVRMRPGMYIGSTGVKGLHHILWEIVDNAIDEAANGYANKVKVTLHEDGSASVEDNGRGIPVDIHPKEKVSGVQLVFTKLHAGGKFGQGNYEYSGGLHGVGASVTNALSEWLNVEIYRNKRIYKMSFHSKYNQRKKKVDSGIPDGPLEDTGIKTNRQGSYIRFKPDASVFSETNFDLETVEERLNQLAFLNRGVEITLIDERISMAEVRRSRAAFGENESENEDGESETIVTRRDEVFPCDRESVSKRVTALREKYGFTEYAGESVEFHPSGCVTFAILGTKARQEDKLAFDPDRSKRRKIYEEVCETFSEYVVFVGGSSSFDMAPKPYNKYYALDLYCREHGYSHDEVIFVGDDYGTGGNDESVYRSDFGFICIDDYRTLESKLAHLL